MPDNVTAKRVFFYYYLNAHCLLWRCRWRRPRQRAASSASVSSIPLYTLTLSRKPHHWLLSLEGARPQRGWRNLWNRRRLNRGELIRARNSGIQGFWRDFPYLNIVLRSLLTTVSTSCVWSIFSANERSAACYGEIGKYHFFKDNLAPYRAN